MEKLKCLLSHLGGGQFTLSLENPDGMATVVDVSREDALRWAQFIVDSLSSPVKSTLN